MKTLLLMLTLIAVPAHAGDNLKQQLWGGNQPIWGNTNNQKVWSRNKTFRQNYSYRRDEYRRRDQVIVIQPVIVVPRPQTCYRSANNPTVTVCMDQ